MASSRKAYNSRVLIFFAVTTIFALPIWGRVLAQETSLESIKLEIKRISGLDATQRQAEANALRIKPDSERCQIVSANIQRRISFYDSNFVVWESKLTRIIANLANLTARLDALGVDASEVKEVRKEIENKLLEFVALRNDLVFKFTDAKQYVCSNDQTSFRPTINAVAEVVTQIRSTATELKQLTAKAQVNLQKGLTSAAKNDNLVK